MPFPTFTPTIPELLRHARQQFGDAIWLVVDGAQLTFADADARSAGVAKGLLGEGLGKGSRLGVLKPNRVGFGIAALALGRVGAVVVPINTVPQTPELGWLVRHADLPHVFAQPGFLNNDYLGR